MKTGIYAVLDNLAEEIVGGLHTHKHDASAVRFFGDLASNPETLISRHVADYSLIRLGHINEINELEPDKHTVITGAAWLAAQAPDDKQIQLLKERA